MLLDIDGQHFYVITRMAGFTGKSYWCSKCDSGYSNRQDHKCERGDCLCCNSSPDCPPTPTYVFCDDCNRWFKGQTCFQNHRETEIHHANGKRRYVIFLNLIFFHMHFTNFFFYFSARSRASASRSSVVKNAVTWQSRAVVVWKNTDATFSIAIFARNTFCRKTIFVICSP